MCTSRAIIFFLLFTISFELILPDVELEDILALPTLLTHYSEHLASGSDLSFIGFLALHYSDSTHASSDPVNHAKLPFSKRHHHSIAFQFIPDPAGEVQYNLRVSDITISGVVYTAHPSSEVTLSVWQPPRV